MLLCFLLFGLVRFSFMLGYLLRHLLDLSSVMIYTSTICIIFVSFFLYTLMAFFRFRLFRPKTVVISLISTFSASAKLPFVLTRLQIGTLSLQFHMLFS